MPDTDVLADAFASFTESVGAEIAAPGAAEVRRTIKRRRARNTLVTACVLVAVLAGVATWDAAAPGRPRTTTSPGGSLANGFSWATLEQYREQAVNALPHLPNRQALTSDSARDIPGLHYDYLRRNLPEVAN